MNYYIDTEYHNYKKKVLWKSADTIELISIGVVSEDNREYYAVSKDFDIRVAWNNDWLRNSILKSIHEELYMKIHPERRYYYSDFTFNNLRDLIKIYGKTNKEIAQEIKEFTLNDFKDPNNNYFRYPDKISKSEKWININPQFYGYFSAFDYVVFSKLFGDFSKYPDQFPMYFIDLKQELDRKVNNFTYIITEPFSEDEERLGTFEEKLDYIKTHLKYPKQTNEHNALSDARFNKQLHEFLKTL